MKKIILIFLLFLLKLSLGSIVIADDIPVIVIAPSKTNQSYSSVGTSVTSISSQEIQESGKFFLGEVLNDNSTGMNYFRSGGYGTVTGIQLRGLPKDIPQFILMELRCQIHLRAIIHFIFQI